MTVMKKGKVNIRPMERRDIDAVLAIYNKIREERIGTKLNRTTDRSILTYEEVASTDPGGPLDLSFVAEINSQVAGYIWSRLAYVGVPVKEVGVIHMVVVDPDYQRQGIARRLIEALAKHCQAKGVNTIRAVLDERDWELRNFFEDLGFYPTRLAIYAKTLES